MKINVKDIESKMQKSIDSLEYNLASIRASQANARVLDRVSFEYYGSPTPLSSMADIRVADARTLTIKPYDASTLKAIEKAIQTSDIGINPQNDGSVIRLTFPPLTEDRRKELAKEIQKIGENSKVAVRSIRRDCVDKLKAMKKASEITEDDLKDGEKEVQKITDGYVKEIDDLAAAKEKEILTV